MNCTSRDAAAELLIEGDIILCPFDQTNRQGPIYFVVTRELTGWVWVTRLDNGRRDVDLSIPYKMSAHWLKGHATVVLQCSEQSDE